MATPPLESEQRAALINHIVQRLHTLDDEALLSLAEVAREPAEQPPVLAEQIEQAITRRRFMMALLGGGLLATTVGAITAWQWGTGRGELLAAQIEQLVAEQKRLWGLVGLYEKLDQAPLDESALSGLEAVSGLLRLVSEAAQRVRDGVQTVQEALRRLEAGLPKVRESLTWLEGLLHELSNKLRLIEDAVGRALDVVAPITQAWSAFFDWLFALLPFGIGQKAREVLERIGDLITGLPPMIESISLNFLILLREEWFSDEKNKGLKGWLIEPVITHLLDPIKALMNSLVHLNAGWEASLNQPVRQAIEQRALVRQQIAEYKARHRLHGPPV